MIRGFCLRVSALVLAFSSTPALVLRRQGPVNTRTEGRSLGYHITRQGSRSQTRSQTRSNSRVEHAASAREVLIDTAGGPCKSSSSDAPIGCIAVPSCLHPPALASPLTARAMEEGTSDARPPPNNCCNRELLRRHVRKTHSRRALQPIGTDRRTQVIKTRCSPSSSPSPSRPRTRSSPRRCPRRGRARPALP